MGVKKTLNFSPIEYLQIFLVAKYLEIHLTLDNGPKTNNRQLLVQQQQQQDPKLCCKRNKTPAIKILQPETNFYFTVVPLPSPALPPPRRLHQQNYEDFE